MPITFIAVLIISYGKNRFKMCRTPLLSSIILAVVALSLFPCLVSGLSSPLSISRRDALIGGGAGLASLGWMPDAQAAAAPSPIAVLGASGRTGVLCVLACLSRGIPVRALSRSGNWPPPSLPSEEILTKNYRSTIDVSISNPLLTVSSCDVKDSIALKEGIKGCQGVIYAASASKQGGNAEAIDNLGVVDAGEACIDLNIGRYVVLSSTATTRPKSLGYIFTNLSVGGIMDEKRKGEVKLMDIYKASRTSSFTIVRPGGLEEPKRNDILGPGSLEISQGDVLAGIISRSDVAEVSVELALSQASNLRNTALELYYTSSAVPCEGRFKLFLTNGMAPRLHGSTYGELFQNIEPGIDYYKP